MDATAIAITLGGLAQPYVQELILRNKLSGRASLLASAIGAMLIATIATYLVGGFASVTIPAFSLLDPSPLLHYLAPRFAEVFALSQLVFHGTESTPADPHDVVGTVATTPAPPPISIPTPPTA